MVRKPSQAVRGADAVYTDVWTSMGQEAEEQKRRLIFQEYQVSTSLFRQAKSDAVFMHCLPAHRGDEVAAEVMDSSGSIVFDQAENRLAHPEGYAFLASVAARFRRRVRRDFMSCRGVLAQYPFPHSLVYDRVQRVDGGREPGQSYQSSPAPKTS